MGFLDTLEKNTNKGIRTENNAITNQSSLDPVLDFFSLAGAMRGRHEEAIDLFNKAYASDRNMALKALFYLRDLRGGAGERDLFREIFKELHRRDPDVAENLVRFVPEYGRWDDFLVTKNTINLIKEQLEADEAAMKAGKPVSLLAKWLPSENASSRQTRQKAREYAKLLGLVSASGELTPYRKKLSALRGHIKLLEQQMSRKEWEKIDFEKIPSQAHKKHIKAFQRHAEDRYQKYLDSVKKGEKKINTQTLFTYQVYDMVKNDWENNQAEAADVMWSNLPDYTNGANALVIADVSGSMEGLYWGGAKRTIEPMSVSVSLALYFAERNRGPFNGYFMTFSDRPQLQKVVGSNLREKMDSIESADWGGSTNIQAAFDAILKAALDNAANADEVPKVLYIISDMEFNEATDDNELTNFEAAKKKFNDSGFELPHLVFWNVDARQKQAPATKYDNNVTLISGLNQSVFQYAVAGKSPLESMYEILNSERYQQITV